jgi:regulator of protease activity HflC (stomatin/prohibitin superfamily)
LKAPGAEDKAVPPAAKPSWTQRFGAWYQRNRLKMTMTVLILLFLVAMYAPDIFVSVQSGQQGVLWSRFFGGTRLAYTMDEGINVKFPWDKAWIYDVRMQQATCTFNALSSDGLTLEVEGTVRYRLMPRETPYLHKFVGPDYLNVLLIPEVASHAREQISQHEPEVFYTQRRDEIEQATLAALRAGLGLQLLEDGERREVVWVEEFFFRSIKLPPQVDAAIQSKLAQRHLMLEYNYRIEREQKEATRKTIEAQGIRSFQDIVAEGISQQYLQWKGIDATLALAQSPNAKVVVIGGGGNGLPLILNLDTAAGGATTTPAPARAGAGSIAPRPGSGPSSPPAGSPPAAAGAGAGSIEGATGRGPSSPPADAVPPVGPPGGIRPPAPSSVTRPPADVPPTPPPPGGGGS